MPQHHLHHCLQAALRQRFHCHGLVLLLLLLGGLAETHAQTITQNDTMYVSVQDPASATQSGSRLATATEGRVIDIVITSQSGPISVSPTSFNLTGPPCPTYDTSQATVPRSLPIPPPASTTATGSVTVSPMPPAGSSTTASIRAKDNGYYTRCLLKQLEPANISGWKVQFPQELQCDLLI